MTTRGVRAGIVLLSVALMAAAGCGLSGSSGGGGRTQTRFTLPSKAAASPSAADPQAPVTLADETMAETVPAEKTVGAVKIVRLKARQFRFTPNHIVAKLGQEVVIQAESMDVTHGFALPDFGIDVTLPPGEIVTIDFIADKPGNHEFHCSRYCGIGHGGMRGTVEVVPNKGLP
jgi:cytochrome c oxidase subunit 2